MLSTADPSSAVLLLPVAHGRWIYYLNLQPGAPDRRRDRDFAGAFLVVVESQHAPPSRQTVVDGGGFRPEQHRRADSTFL